MSSGGGNRGGKSGNGKSNSNTAKLSPASDTDRLQFMEDVLSTNPEIRPFFIKFEKGKPRLLDAEGFETEKPKLNNLTNFDSDGGAIPIALLRMSAIDGKIAIMKISGELCAWCAWGSPQPRRLNPPFPNRAPTHFGLVCGIARLGFPYGRTPPSDPLRTKRGRSRRLPTPPTPRAVVSLHSDHHPTAQKLKWLSRWRGDATKMCSVARRVVLDTKDLVENRWNRSKVDLVGTKDSRVESRGSRVRVNE